MIKRVLHLLRYVKRVVIKPFEGELCVLDRFLSKAEIAIDVGANTGLYTERLARKSLCVLAFEPDPKCLAYLEGVSGKNWRIVGAAASESSGSADFRTPVDNGRALVGFGTLSLENRFHGVAYSEESVESVTTVSIDEYLEACHLNRHGVSFIKIDVEGHEQQVLNGARGAIQRHRPTILVEIEECHNPNWRSVFSFFRGLDYIALTLGGDRRIFNSVDEDILLESQKKYRRGSQSYLNNVFFVPRERRASLNI